MYRFTVSIHFVARDSGLPASAIRRRRRGGRRAERAAIAARESRIGEASSLARIAASGAPWIAALSSVESTEVETRTPPSWRVTARALSSGFDGAAAGEPHPATRTAAAHNTTSKRVTTRLMARFAAAVRRSGPHAWRVSPLGPREQTMASRAAGVQHDHRAR